jgi:hypothetical protein
MSDDRPKRETMSIEEATVSNMWEIAAIVELLEQKGRCTKQDLYNIITEFQFKNPVPALLRRPSLSLATIRYKVEKQSR